MASELPNHFSLSKLIRPNIASLKPYRCARDDYDQGVLLDANENALGSALASASASGDPCQSISTFCFTRLQTERVAFAALPIMTC